jgi:RNA methyltransferase, TrmH family
MSTTVLRAQAAQLTRSFQHARRSQELVVLEGFHPLKHALRFGAQVEQIVTVDAEELNGLAERYAADIREQMTERALLVSRRVFRQLGPYEPHTGVIGIAARLSCDVKSVLDDARASPVVLLEDPRHRGNLGAVIRVAAAAGAGAVLNTGDQDPWNAVTVRGSAGLHFALPVARIDANALEQTNRPLLAFDPAGRPWCPARVPGRAILAFGSERVGCSRELIARADECVSLPMREGVSSLNLASAVAAALYSLRLAGGE